MARFGAFLYDENGENLSKKPWKLEERPLQAAARVLGGGAGGSFGTVRNHEHRQAAKGTGSCSEGSKAF